MKRKRTFFVLGMILCLMQNNMYVFANNKLAFSSKLSSADTKWLIENPSHKIETIEKNLLVEKLLAHKGLNPVDLLDYMMPVDKEKIESAKQIDLLMLFGNPYDHAPEDAVTLFENSLKDKGCKTLVVVGGIGAGTAPLIAKMKLSVDSQDQVTLTNLGIRKPIFRGNVWKELAKDAVGGGKTAIKTEVRKYISEAELYTEKILQEFIDRGYKREDFLVIFEEDAAEKKALIAAHKGIVILVENASIHAGDNANFARDLLVSVDMFEKLDVSKMVFMQYKDLYRRSCFHMQEKFGTKKEPIHYALDQRRNYSVANPLQKNEHLQFIFQEFINTYNQVKNAKLPFSKLECENVLKFLKDDKVSYLELFESEEKVVLFFEMQKFLGQFLNPKDFLIVFRLMGKQKVDISIVNIQSVCMSV